MMVADNPFEPAPEPFTPSSELRESLPYSEPASELGSAPHPPAGGSGMERTPRRVQWNTDHVIDVADDDDDDDALLDNAPDLALVNRALEDLKDDDYDYRFDPDPGDIEEKELESPEDETEAKEDETIHKLLKPEGADHVRWHVQLGETDGLPTYRPEENAAALVGEHTGKSRWSSIRRRVRTGSLARKGRKQQTGPTVPEHSAISKAETDAARTSANPPLSAPKHQAGMPHLPGGTSVLSSLLALYNSYHHLDSGPGSAASTPGSSRPPSPEYDSPERGRQKKRRSKSPWRRSASDTPSPRAASDEMRRNKIPEEMKRNKSAQSLLRVVHDLRDDRPRQARSGAGVFGALVANTASMAAPAAPSSSTLVASATKPGYHLNRYKLMDNSLPSGPASFPPSRPSSALGAPESPRTSVFGTDSERAYSTDNLVEMRKRRSRPPLLPTRSKEKVLTAEQIEDDRRRKEWESEKKRRKKAKEARKKQEVYIIQHVAAILSRQQFIMKLARALMMFGSPTHRIETQIQATARVLDINAQVVYLPNIMLISFADESTHTSETKFLKQAGGSDLGKLLATHKLYWEVVHDKMSVEDAGRELDRLMTDPPCYNAWQMIVIAGFCSGIIVITSYFGSFVDALMAAPLGMMLQAVQLIALKNDLFSGVFEIVIATVISFLAAVLASTGKFCYTALVSGGIVLILPGFIVLSGALELASRNITAGAVRMGYSVIYSLFLGFGISIGSEVYVKIRGEHVRNATNNTCSATRYDGAPWYLSKPSSYWYFLTVPAFSFFLSLNLQQPLRGRTARRELPIMVLFACAGWVTNYFAGRAFPGRSDIVSAIGSFCVGILGNLYGRFSKGASFPVMVTGILMQLPSGLKEGGLFNFANDTAGGSVAQWATGFRVAGQLVSVAIGLTVGLFVAAVLAHPLGGSRRRGAGIFSF
ncbi:uncharacterized protein CcaverHIS019_0304420 [Cutaneotrichosporon cavernicola]|uniref:Threonine/serine exporter-like N-terminal domain-containing protein n=1 Tax=Cutaneotrichosporon cavernicola TaxID=279322 RepID=A0AA48I6U7_9TREE|nr:uncharacterized protein CcaverHIS019_0304420 [Cutaneotrichosporon cavernicola]BEI90372.1 hypothetical protein CcaverHIS019_0304420 [Cutaneotrichosporon cavernicola]BEI98148.1 hypothetical protein CcaverHIS631_0304470 [Cutaneotrichosporon cavernicola]